MPMFLDWRQKPAVLFDKASAFAITESGGSWKRVEANVVANEGFLVTKGSLERMHADLLTKAPLSDLLNQERNDVSNV